MFAMGIGRWGDMSYFSLKNISNYDLKATVNCICIHETGKLACTFANSDQSPLCSPNKLHRENEISAIW